MTTYRIKVIQPNGHAVFYLRRGTFSDVERNSHLQFPDAQRIEIVVATASNHDYCARALYGELL